MNEEFYQINLVEKNYETYWDINNFNSIILKQRKDKFRIVTILKDCIEKGMVWDELVLLAHILNILDRNNIAVSQKEVRSALNKYHKENYHRNKRNYLNSLYKTFKIKKGTKTKPQPPHKPSPVVISEGINPLNPSLKKEDIQNLTQTITPPENQLKTIGKEVSDGNRH